MLSRDVLHYEEQVILTLIVTEENPIEEMTDNNEFKVTSEIYEGSSIDQNAKPHISTQNIVTNFSFKVPVHMYWLHKNSSEFQVDEDGDIMVPRRNGLCQHEAVISIEQSNSTTLQLVGLQVWRGALVLADYLLHTGVSIIKDQVVLELGSGTGLTSIVASMFAKEVICTDVDIGTILDLIKANFARNNKLVKAKYSVLDLDFYARQWSNSIETKLTDVSVVLVADVIYDNDLTEAFVKTLKKILSIPPKKTVFIALEKRYVFTVADLECGAPCYDYFMEFISKHQNLSSCMWHIEQIPIDFPQYFNYERVKQLVLLKLTT